MDTASGGLASSVQLATGEFAAASVGRWPIANVVAWFSNSIRPASFLVFVFLCYLFPTGRLPDRRWRWLVALASISAGVSVLAFAFRPGPLEDFPNVSNPLGLDGPAGLISTVEDIAGPGVMLFGIFGGVASLVVRFLGARGTERLQLRWMAYAAVVAPIGLVVLNLIFPTQMEGDLGFFAWTILPMLVPAAIAVAILRYRLYEIDRIINRTIVYGAVTALLALIYLASVTLLSGLARPLTGSSDLAVAASTLGVAALFGPLRRRVQGWVDLRFYRSRYDTQRTLEAFSARLRDRVGVEAVGEELVGVVKAALQPSTVSVWVRGGRRAPAPPYPISLATVAATPPSHSTAR